MIGWHCSESVLWLNRCSTCLACPTESYRYSLLVKMGSNFLVNVYLYVWIIISAVILDLISFRCVCSRSLQVLWTFKMRRKNFFFLFISNKFLVVIRYIDIIVNSLSTSFLNHLFRLHFSASAQFNKCYETLKKSIWNPYVYNVDGECLIEKVQNQYGVFF